MKQIKDLNNKRICDISEDRKALYIRKGDCITTVTAGEDGKLNIKSEKTPQAS